MSQLAAGTLTNPGDASPTFRLSSPVDGFQAFADIAIWGVFTGAAVQIQKTYDAGVTWLPINGASIAATATPQVAVVQIGAEHTILHRLVLTAITTGPVSYRVGQ